jgi:hypothetical protein
MSTFGDIDIKKRAQQYIDLRDKITAIKKRHTEELAPYTEALHKLNMMLLDHLNSINTDTTAVRGVGTVYRKENVSATLADAEAFRDYVIQSGDWNMADIKANKTAVKDYVDEHGTPPVGVTYTVTFDVGVRRSGSSK